MAHLVIVVALSALLLAVAQAQAEKAYLLLCSASGPGAAAPWSSTTYASRLASLCTGGDFSVAADLDKAVPAVLPLKGYLISWTNQAGLGGVPRPVTRPQPTLFTADLATGTQLPPEVMLGLSQANTYTSTYLVSAGPPGASGSVLSTWLLRNVIINNITVSWSDAGPDTRLLLAPLQASYKTYFVDPATGPTKYGRIACINYQTGVSSSTAETC